MDPVSALNLAATLVDLANLSMTIVHMMQKLQKAPKARTSLSLELVSLVSMMSKLKQRIDTSNAEKDPWFITVSSLGGDHGVFHQFESTLKWLAKTLQPGVGKDFIWVLKESEIKDSLNHIERIKSLISLALHGDHLELSLAAKNAIDGLDTHFVALNDGISRLEGGIQDVAVGVLSLNTESSDQQRRTISNWLSPLNFLGRQEDVFRRRQEGTNRWLLESKEFYDWVEGKNKLLRCSGIPGGGKTTVASLVVEHLKTYSKFLNVGVMIIYCNYKEQAEQSIANLISSLIKQLIQEGGPLNDELISLYRRHNDRDTRPSLQETSKILQNLINSYDKVFIIVDALDESPETMGIRASLTTELLSYRSEKCNLMFTARNYAGLETLFGEEATIEVAATDEDLLHYVNARIAQAHRLSKHCSTNPGLQEEIIKVVVGKAQGMFLLARLHMDALVNKTTVKAARTALNELPTTLNTSYDDCMARIYSQNKEDRDLAMEILAWITFAKQPLKVLELRHALAVEYDAGDLDKDNLADDDILLSVCCGLITIEPSTTDVRLVHYTLQTYFEAVRNYRFPQAEMNMTSTCLTYLSFNALGGKPCKDDRQLEHRLNEYPLLLYAAKYWGDHARGEPETKITDAILKFLEEDGRLALSTQIMSIPEYQYSGFSQAYPHQVESLWLAASFGLASIASIQLRSGCAIDAPDPFRGHTPLHMAAMHGHLDVARLLLENFALIDVPCTRYGFTPLRLAAQQGHGDFVLLLLTFGADINSKAKDGKQPLHGAAMAGLVPTLKSLLDRGADIEMRDTSSNTALHVAANSGQVAAVEYILDRGANIESKEKGGRTAVMIAASGGHIITTLTLLKRGANPNSRDRDFATPIIEAAEAGNKTVLVLLENGADVNARNIRGQTALDFTVVYRRHDNLPILLRWGANVNSRDQDGFTALHRAAWNGDAISVTMLLKHRADPNIANVQGETALQQAAWKGYTEVCHILLEGGAHVNTASIDGQLALHRAAGNGHSTTSAELLVWGADSGFRNNRGETARDLAEAEGHENVLQLFSLLNPDIYSPTGPQADWEVVERAKALDLGQPLIPLQSDWKQSTNETRSLQMNQGRRRSLSKPSDFNITSEHNAKVDPAIADANEKLSDPAVFQALNLEPQCAKVELCGPLGFSMKAIITAIVNGEAKKYFMKTRLNETRDDLYYGEYLGLAEMYEACPNLVPRPIAHGNFSATMGCFLVTDYLEQDTSGNPSSGAGTSLAQKLSQLHMAPTQIPEGFTKPVFGFPATTYCGATPQPSSYMTSWHDFFVEERIRMIFQLCEVEQGSDDELRYWVERTINGPIAHLLADGHLGGAKGIKPAIVHGNLWYGNKMRSSIYRPENAHLHPTSLEDMLFDPSSAWCHNEFEMGILVLFGGFSAGFFQEYHRLLPKTEPKHEYEDRIELYQLYHQLNHYALYRGVYRAGSIERMRKLCQKYPTQK